MNRARVYTPVVVGNLVLLLTASVLLAALWARSYSWRDTLLARVAGNRSLEIDSLDGQLYFSLVPASREWDLVSWPRTSGATRGGCRSGGSLRGEWLLWSCRGGR